MFTVVGLLIIYFQIVQTQATPRLVLPEERTTGLGCIPEGRTVSYECTVNDTTGPPPLGSTTWRGTALQCANNQITLLHSLFSSSAPVSQTCGGITARSLEVNGTNFVSNLSLTATAELNGTTLSCYWSSQAEIGTDVLAIGSFPSPPGSLTATLSGSSLTVNWSPPSGPVEGGVGGYVLDVTGEGCGCMSMNVGGDTTNVTCSGWTATGQNCSFEVRTLSQDCGFISDPVNEKIVLQATCDSAILGAEFSTFLNLRASKTSNGAIVYNGTVVGSTGYLICDDGFEPDADSINRHCMSDGNWSGNAQNCVPEPTYQSDVVVKAVPSVVVTVFFVILLTLIGIGTVWYKRKKRGNNDILSSTNLSFSKLDECAPAKFSRPIDAAVHEHTVYCRRYREKVIDKYNSIDKKWTTLDCECKVDDTSLVVLPLHTHNGETEFVLHTVGGLLSKNVLVSDLYCYRQEDREWKSSPFPPMNTKRKQVTTIRTPDHLIAAGGRGEHGPVKTVELLAIDSSNPPERTEWRNVASLPQAVFCASGLVNQYALYILGGCKYDRKTQRPIDINSAFKVSLDRLCQSHEGNKNVFIRIQEIPENILRSTYTNFKYNNKVYAIGGSENEPNAEEAKSVKFVFEYDHENNVWKQQVNKLIEPRCYCFAASFDDHIVIAGGYTKRPDEDCTKSVEIARIVPEQEAGIEGSNVELLSCN